MPKERLPTIDEVAAAGPDGELPDLRRRRDRRKPGYRREVGTNPCNETASCPRHRVMQYPHYIGLDGTAHEERRRQVASNDQTAQMRDLIGRGVAPFLANTAGRVLCVRRDTRFSWNVPGLPDGVTSLDEFLDRHGLKRAALVIPRRSVEKARETAKKNQRVPRKLHRVMQSVQHDMVLAHILYKPEGWVDPIPPPSAGESPAQQTLCPDRT